MQLAERKYIAVQSARAQEFRTAKLLFYGLISLGYVKIVPLVIGNRRSRLP